MAGALSRPSLRLGHDPTELPSLRAKRSNPEQYARSLDCFVDSLLAMMGWTAPDGIIVPDW